jgi:colanic acid biosynthesis glycosyl transferase WcaI
MKENLVRKGVPAVKISVLPNWVDLNTVRPVAKENTFRTEHGLQGRFVVLFAGNVGFAAGLEGVLQAAAVLRREQDVVFLIVGEGSAKASLARMVGDLGLSNVRFVTSQPRQRLSEVLGVADVSLVPLRPGMGSLSVPSKTMSIMASARPVLAVVPVDSEVRRIVEQARCGRWVSPEDPASLAAEILALRSEGDQLESLGVNGRRYAELHYGRAEVVSEYHRLLKEVARGRSTG